MRQACLLLAVCASAAADDLAEEVRAFIDRHRAPASLASYETVVADAPAPPADRLRLEYRVGNYVYSCGLLSLTRRGDVVDLLRVDVRVADPATPLPPGFEPGVRIARATVPHAEFDRMLKKVALVRGARLRQREDTEVETEGTVSFAISGAGRLRLEVGDGTPLEVVLEPAGAEVVIQDTIDDRGRALLLLDLIEDEADRWPVEEADAKGVSERLAGDLGEVDDWRRRLRVVALGYLGRAEAMPALRRLERDAYVDAALAQIRISSQCEGAGAAPAALLDLVAKGHPLLDSWARHLLAARFPDGYIAAIRARLEAEDPSVRADALTELERLAPDDLEPARRAREDPHACVRAEAARILGDANALLLIARDKTLAGEESMARGSAIIYLTWLDQPRDGREWVEPPGDCDVTGKALVAILRDESEGFDVRAKAARGLGDLGYRPAIPDLLATFGAGPTRHWRRWELASEAAYALGQVRAKEAVMPFVRALHGGQGDPAYRSTVGIALAEIGARRGMPALRRQREIGRADPTQIAWWDASIALLDAIQRRDAMAILERVRGSPRFPSTLLADVFTGEELRALAARDDLGSMRRFVERAVVIQAMR
ncbi:MAG TPA: hypothetical protein VFY93_08875 [Planctomycetota bacterium]|nr:hypothetical protein [Planctomycetota bacterium]